MKILKTFLPKSRSLNYCLSTFLFIIITITASAQHNVKVELSEQYEEPGLSAVFDVVGYDDGGFVFGRYTRKGYFP